MVAVGAAVMTTEVAPTPETARYLATKRDRMGHLLMDVLPMPKKD